MSRAAVQDNSSTVSLFPFLAVLLCTMGSLVVVLVAVTRLSRDQAVRQAAQKRAEAASHPAPVDDDRRRQLEQVEQYLARLAQVRAEAQRQLRDDQSRLSDIEDHMRRLQDQAASLGAAAVELDALGKKHHDDRQQAQREVARLQKLVADTRASIEEFKKEAQSRPRSYAIVPYYGPHDTHRPPVYIECRQDAVILQPEGIRLTDEDFREPLGPGNPLASALRAAREHLAGQDSSAAIGGENDPYPLILVRPDGIANYYLVRSAIESWDSSFGYQFVEGDWELAFPPANPELAKVESQAIELARARIRMLAAAAPRAYGSARTAGGGIYPSDADGVGGGPFDDDFAGGSGNRYGDADLDGTIGDDSVDGATGGRLLADGPSPIGEESSGTGAGPGGLGSGENGGLAGAAGPGQLGGGPHGGAESESAPGSTAPAADGGDGTVLAGQPAPSGVAGSEPTGSAGGDTAGEAAAEGAPGGSPGGTGSMASAAVGGSPGSAGACSNQDTNSAPSVSVFEDNPSRQDADPTLAQTPSLSTPEGRSGAIPIRRSIHVVVRDDRIAILPERTAASDSLTGGREIPLSGATEASLDPFVSALKDHIREWGIAGRGLFWRPVLVLSVGPDGQQRANELVRLLRHSGIELRYATTAKHDAETDPHATR